MKNFFLFAGIPLAIFAVFFGIPRLIASLVNTHTDAGLLAIVVLVCGIFGLIANKLYNNVKETTDHE